MRARCAKRVAWVAHGLEDGRAGDDDVRRARCGRESARSGRPVTLERIVLRTRHEGAFCGGHIPAAREVRDDPSACRGSLLAPERVTVEPCAERGRHAEMDLLRRFDLEETEHERDVREVGEADAPGARREPAFGDEPRAARTRESDALRDVVVDGAVEHRNEAEVESLLDGPS
jgi:hypothetical protein